MKKWIIIYFALHCLCFVNSTNKLVDSSYVQQQQQKVECMWKRQGSSSATAQHNSIEGSDNSRYLSCRMKTISGLDGLIKNLTTYNSQNQIVNALKLECSDVLFAESSLVVENNINNGIGDYGAFNKHLHELTIQFCKIKYVPSMTFKSLKNLKSLTLQTHNADWSTINLELHSETFSGLSELRRLNLADNNIWTLPNGIFCPLFTLKYLNLSKNHLNDVSQVGFSLKKAATPLGGNDNDLFTGTPPSAASSQASCNSGVEQLDLSYNNLISIPNNCFNALKNLNFMHLDSNQLTILDDNSFQGLDKLQFLNLTNNRLIALPPELFEKTRELKRLYIANNSLAVLAPGLFEKLNQLEVLDLSFNELTSSWINRDTFLGLNRLVVLKLNNNKMTKVDQFVFREVYELQALNLEFNQIEMIAQNAFIDLRNLHQLLLSDNQLKVIESKHFAGLYSLNQLILESNEISNIHPNAFDNLTNALVDLSLNDNKLKRIPDSIRKLKNLQALDLGKNQITEIESDSFDGLEQLAGLRLTDNQITTITKGAFVALKSIHVLNFASNKIKHIDQSSFLTNEKLRAIRLDSNALEDISSAFTSLSSLVLLNVSNNNIKWFDFSHLPSSLEWMDIHNNNITELGNYFDVTNQLKINYLDVSNNKIRKIKNDLIPKNITTINLSNNLIDDVPSGTFLNKKHIRKIFLNGNMIKKLQITSLIVSKFDILREAPEIYLAGNPLHCDCHLEWLRNINELSEQRRQLPKLIDMNKIKCTMEHNHEIMMLRSSNDDVAIKSFNELSSNDFLCKYENHCHTLCQCCQNDQNNGSSEDDDDDDDSPSSECKCKMTCPDQCSCYHDNTWNKNIVDCGNANIQSFPQRIPIDVTTLYIDGNNLTHLSHHQFVGKNRLEVLYLNDSNIHTIANGTFDELKSLRVLHLNRNQLKRLHGNEFKELMLLNAIYLDHNRLTHIGDNTFNHMKFLRTIDLSDNRLVDFNPITQLAASSRSGMLQQVYLDGDNKWNCDCKSLVQLIEWIRNRSNNFNVQRMLCNDNRIVGDVLNNCELLQNTNIFGEVATPPSSLNSLQQEHSTIVAGNGNGSPNYRHNIFGGSGGIGSGGYIPLFAAILVTIITSALLIALVCIFRQDVKLWAFSKYGLRFGGDGTTKNSGSNKKKSTTLAAQHLRYNNGTIAVDDEEYFAEKVHDAYFIYSVNDTDLLTQILLPEMQNLGYNISSFNHHNKPIMTRDNFQVTNYLIDALKAGTDASHKIVIVLSFNFLQTEWCDSNFRCAMQALIESLMNQRKNKNIILILTVPVQIIQMDPLLQLLIRTCTVICWGEKRFWTKLRYALPDVSSDKKYIQGDNRYTAAPTSTLQRGSMMMAVNSTGSNNQPSDWYNLSPVVCSGYSMPVNQYQDHHQQQQYHQQFYTNENEMPNNLRGTSYDYEQPDYNTRGPQSIGGSSTCLGHVYSTIPETPPLSSSSNASTPTLSHKHGKASHLIEQQQHCDSSNNDHFV
ncbi:toll-like receptor Tollo [Chironomus tepperi]|uniref:toll-like receptor Tollo n=1 Tax=Chironomus tepperi TaxID=113505 RepID=UPI00391EF04B